ncbi:hypothetical protein [Micromonospora aurantiaca]|nr:hypothetical protein [Micromonospora aurantiaca]
MSLLAFSMAGLSAAVPGSAAAPALPASAPNSFRAVAALPSPAVAASSVTRSPSSVRIAPVFFVRSPPACTTVMSFARMSLLIFSAAVQSSLSLIAAADGEGAAEEGAAEAEVAAGPAVVEGFSSPHAARPSTAQVRRIGKIRFVFTSGHASRCPSLIKLGLPRSAPRCAGGRHSRRPPACPAAVRRDTGRRSTRTVLPYPAPRASSVARWAEPSPLLVGLRRRDPGRRVLDARAAGTTGDGYRPPP